MPLDSSVPMIDPNIRRPAVVLAVLCAAVLGILAVCFAGLAGQGEIEAGIDARVQEMAAQQRVALRALVPLGSPSTVTAASLALSALGLMLGRPRLAAVALAAPLLTGAAAAILQPMIGRTLAGGFALPSGHTAGATSIAMVVALIVVDRVGRHRLSVAILSLVGVLAVGITMAVALVANELHYMSDTVAGLCTAIVLVLGSALIVDAVVDLGRGRHP